MTSAQPLTVLHVSTQRGWHGGEEQARLLALGLRDRGHRCAIISRADGEFARRMDDCGFEVATFPGRGRNPRAFLAIRRTIASRRPHVVHYHDPHGMIAAGLAMTGRRVPARIAARRVDFPIRSAWLYRRLCDMVIADSRAIERVCLAGGIPQAMLRMVYEGVDPSRGSGGDRTRGRQSVNLNDDQALILVVATLTEHKGHRFLLEAMPRIVAEQPQVQLALAGDGHLRDALEAMARDLGITPHVRFLGYRQDIPDLLKAADLFVLCSVTEGLGSSVIDAMFAKTPVVATSAGGIPELVGPMDGDDAVGLIVPPGDSTSLGEAILTALRSPDSCRQLAERAHDRAWRMFTADQMVEQTIAVYRELLERRR